jgi:hypothetical protein
VLRGRKRRNAGKPARADTAMQMSLSEIDYDAEQLKGTCCEAKKSGGGRSADLNIKVEMQVSELMFSVSVS